MKELIRSIIVLALILRAASALAQAPPPGENASALRVLALELKGMVQYTEPNGNGWKKLTKGISLEVGSEVRTNFRSYVKLRIEPDQVFLLDSMSTVKILRASFDQSAKKVTTDLGMKYGRARYDVESAGIEHECRVHGPNATLAIRGTDANIRVGYGLPAMISSTHGRILAMLRGQRTIAVALGSNQLAAVTQDRTTPASNALGETRVDPLGKFAGRTSVEDQLVEDYPELGGFNPAIIDALASRLGVDRNTTFIGTIPTRPLVILLGWTGAPLTTDVNLSVLDTQGNALTANMPTSPTGGLHSGDGVSDATGNGSESVVFRFAPAGSYNIKADLISPTTAFTFLQVDIDGVPISPPPIGPTLLTPVNPSFSVDVTVPRGPYSKTKPNV